MTTRTTRQAVRPPVGEVDPASLGSEIRKLRKARGKSLAEVAMAVGRSISYISQLERGQSQLSIADLKRIAQALDVPLGWFFVTDNAPQGERGLIVRSPGRRRLGAVTSGLVEELLSPDIGGAFEMFLSTFEPGAESAFTNRETEEEGYIVKGVLDLWIGRKKRFRLEAGDSFRIVNEPFRWANPTLQETVAVWVISPPTY